MVEAATPEKLVYRSYTQQQLDDQYNQRSLVPDAGIYRETKVAASERVRAKLRGITDVPYGPSEDELLDVFPADKEGSPSLVFLHGGAWKSGHKDESSYVAECFVERGANVIITNFALVPKVHLSEQVRQAAASISWVYHNARSFGGDPERVFVCGHSSGGHLAGMMAVYPWEPAGLLKGSGAFSGMFDLEPVQLSWRNTYLDLTPEEATSLSSIRMIPDRGMPMIVGYGSGELDEFQRQSSEFAAAWRQHGNPCEEMKFDGLNHFQVQELLSAGDGPMVKALCQLMGIKPKRAR